MHRGETIGTEQFAGLAPGDAARWLLAIVLVAGFGGGGVLLARQWMPPAGDASIASAPAVLLELEPLPAPEPEIAPPPPMAEPLPEPVVEPPPPEPVEEPVAEPEEVIEPPPVVEEPQVEPEPQLEHEPEVEPEPEPQVEPQPVPEPLPEADAPTVAFPMPAMMSADMRQRRTDTPATNPQQPRPTPPPERPRTQQAAPQPAATQSAPSQPAVASAGPTVEQWQQQLRRQIDRAKRYPREAERARQEGLVQVAVTIDGSGRLLSHSLLRSSGVDALDQAAMDAVRRASPFPRPPAAAGQGAIPFVVPIRFNAP